MSVTVVDSMHRALALWVLVAVCVAPGAIGDPVVLASAADFEKAPTLRVDDRSDLSFGDVLPGVNFTLSYTDPQAGYWRIKGEKDLEVQLNFLSLPTQLDGGGDQMPVSFASDAAAYAFTKNASTAQTFDPNVGVILRLNTQGQLYVWLGGTARPKSTQSPGTYAATITLEVFYTGN